MRLLWCISDLHIGDAQARDKFGREGETALLGLIRHIEGTAADTRTLVIAGDIFDFLKVDVPATEPRREFTRALRIAQAYPHVFSAFRSFVAKGNELVWVTGNHDKPLDDPNIAEVLRSGILPAGGGSRFSVVSQFFDRDFRVYIEHGSSHDKSNNYGADGRLPLGSRIVEEFLARWEVYPCNGERPFELIDNLRPYTYLPAYILARMNGDHRYEEIGRQMLGDLVSTVLPECPGLSSSLISALQRVPGSTEAVVRLVELVFPFIDPADFTSYREYAEQLLSRDSGYWPREGRPEHIILGHTHYLDQKELKQGGGARAAYYNTGTWMRNVFITPDGRLGASNRRCPVLRLELSDGPAQAYWYDALAGRDFCVENVLNFYRSFLISI